MRTRSSPTTSAEPDAARRREQRAWYWYDWANSAYVTTVAGVLFLYYLIGIAEADACGAPGTPLAPCTEDLIVLGVPVSPGSLVFYVATAITIISAVLLPVVGAVADRSAHKKQMLGGFAWFGSACVALMFLVTGTSWELGVLLLFGASLALGSSLVVYDSILCQIATPEERDGVSSRGWALGYLGAGLLLGANFALLTYAQKPGGLSVDMAIRVSILSAAVWWAGFTLIPFLGLRNRQPVAVVPARGSLVRQSFGQLFATLRDLRRYPVTLTFLGAYVFYNDGLQTVIGAATVYGTKELGFAPSAMMGIFLFVQFVAFGGALLSGRLARRFGPRRVLLGGLGVWMLMVTFAMVVPAQRLGLFAAIAFGIGLVLGGTQALSRSFYSRLVPRGREAEYFSLYQAAERGTSWLGMLTFGVVHQLAGSYRPAIFALIIFFVVGAVLLWRVDLQRGMREAGTLAPVADQTGVRGLDPRPDVAPPAVAPVAPVALTTSQG